MNEDKIIFLLHMDHCDGDHDYALYEIPKDRLDEIPDIAFKAQEQYDKQDEEADELSIEDFLERGLKKAGIEYRNLEFGATWMSTC